MLRSSKVSIVFDSPMMVRLFSMGCLRSSFVFVELTTVRDAHGRP